VKKFETIPSLPNPALAVFANAFLQNQKIKIKNKKNQKKINNYLKLGKKVHNGKEREEKKNSNLNKIHLSISLTFSPQINTENEVHRSKGFKKKVKQTSANQPGVGWALGYG
jgi:flagellar biosynthesis component FlhA